MLLLLPDMETNPTFPIRDDDIFHYGKDEKFLSELMNFVNFVVENNYKLTVRPHPKSMNSGFLSKIKYLYPMIKVDESPYSFNLFNKYELVIHGYINTGFIESILSGATTVALKIINKYSISYEDMIQDLSQKRIILNNFEDLKNYIKNSEYKNYNYDYAVRAISSIADTDIKWDIQFKNKIFNQQ
jgi:hypothetical protein